MKGCERLLACCIRGFGPLSCDSILPPKEHLRCNICVKIKDPSGRPIIEGSALPVAECDLWAFFASKCMHETAPLQGGEPRIVFGFGWSVPPDHKLREAPAGFEQE